MAGLSCTKFGTAQTQLFPPQSLIVMPPQSSHEKTMKTKLVETFSKKSNNLKEKSASVEKTTNVGEDDIKIRKLGRQHSKSLINLDEIPQENLSE